jgi:hypothetical protein
LKRLAAAVLAASIALPATAADCVQNNAVYTEKNNGYVLTFRPTEPWEASANTMAVMDLAFPNGTHIWGTVWIPNGTSHDRTALYTTDCKLPTFNPKVDIDPTEGSTGEELDACQVWAGPLMALENNDIASPLWHDGNKPAATLLFPDLGPVIRYSGLVLSPGDEPHDVFTFTGCTP